MRQDKDVTVCEGNQLKIADQVPGLNNKDSLLSYEMFKTYGKYNYLHFFQMDHSKWTQTIWVLILEMLLTHGQTYFSIVQISLFVSISLRHHKINFRKMQYHFCRCSAQVSTKQRPLIPHIIVFIQKDSQKIKQISSLILFIKSEMLFH